MTRPWHFFVCRASRSPTPAWAIKSTYEAAEFPLGWLWARGSTASQFAFERTGAHGALLGMSMRFDDGQLQDALVKWRELVDVKERSAADNIWFEQRVSAARQNIFEQEANGASNPVSLRRAHADYWGEFVRVDEDVPHTFEAMLAPADLGPIDEMQKIVRIEGLTRPLVKHGMTFERLKEAVTNNETAVVDGFLATWNASSMRDWRPAFAAFKDEVMDDLTKPEWPSRLRDRLGLAHYDCAAGPIPIALMEYSVAEVKTAATGFAISSAFTAPTVLDSGPWPYFFPAPPELCCGRTMALYEVQDDKELLAEILHFRVAYKREHLARLDEIRVPPSAFDLRGLRNHHLLALHVASGRDDYGEEIPA